MTSPGGKKRSETSSSRQSSTTAGPILPSSTLSRGLFVTSAVGNIIIYVSKLEVEEWRLLATIDEHNARQQQDPKRGGLKRIPPMPQFEGVRPEVG